MVAGRGLNRIVHRAIEEVYATMRIASKTSIKGALITFFAKIDIQKMNRNGFQEPPEVRKRLLAKHEVMMDYFEKEFQSFSQIYDYDRVLPEAAKDLRNRIWMCWWQGMENAPELVKVCVKSVQKNAGPYTVTIITEQNYKHYVDIPDWLEKKYQMGIISRTHYSDYLRFSLLAAYGGLWLDASMFCTAPVLENYMCMPVWSIKRPDYLHCSIASGYFATYSLGCTYENRWIFATIRDCLEYYWQGNDMLIDYLMLDYLIIYAQRRNHRIAKAFSSISPNNPCCDDLIKVLGQPYDETQWQAMKNKTSLFKLSWKQSYSMMDNGRNTFFAKLIKDAL